jgi:ribosomal protein L29
MESKSLNQLSAAELVALVSRLRSELCSLRVKRVFVPLENPSRLRLLRRDIARALSALTAVASRA